jgi:hypothetical protein
MTSQNIGNLNMTLTSKVEVTREYFLTPYREFKSSWRQCGVCGRCNVQILDMEESQKNYALAMTENWQNLPQKSADLVGQNDTPQHIGNLNKSLVSKVATSAVCGMFERGSCVQISWSRGHNVQRRGWGLVIMVKRSCPFPTSRSNIPQTALGISITKTTVACWGRGMWYYWFLESPGTRHLRSNIADCHPHQFNSFILCS